MRSRFVFLTLTFFLLAVAAAADESSPQAAAVRAYRADLKVADPDHPDKTITPGDVLQQAGGLLKPREALDKLGAFPSSLRFDGSKKGDVVRIYCFYRPDGNKKPEIRAKEEPRQPVIVGQLKTLGRLASAIAASLAGPEEKINVDSADYVLKLKRATLTVSAEIKDNPQGLDNQQEHPSVQWFIVFDFTTPEDGTNAPRTEVDVLTGAREAWSISADVPLSTIGDVKLDDKGENVELSDTPDVFFAGFNFAVAGDVIRPPANFFEALTVKALLKASRRPSDSVGIGIGLRPGLFANAPSLLQVFDTLSPFVAYTRTRFDKDHQNADGTTSKVHLKRNDVVVGISLDLEKAFDFVKGKGGGEGEKK